MVDMDRRTGTVLQMVRIGLIILILCIDTISKPAMESKMRYAKGLESAINSMSEFEQTLAREIAQIIGERGFPLDDLTRVQFDRPIGSNRERYRENEISFFVNPLVYDSEIIPSSHERISIRWEDPTVIYNNDGSMEFEVGKTVPLEDLKMELYGLSESYRSRGIIRECDECDECNKCDELLSKIDTLFKSYKDDDISAENENIMGRSTGIEFFTSQGIDELLYNNLLSIKKRSESLYEMYISPLRTLRDSAHFSGIRVIYILELDLDNSTIILKEEYDPTLMPTPVVNPRLKLERDSFIENDWPFEDE